MTPDELKPALTRLVQRLFPGFSGTIDPVRLTGGASYETWAFEVLDKERAVPLILRRMPASAVTLSYSAGPETEAELMNLARGKGVPVPGIRHVLNEMDGMGRGFIADRIEGETLGRKIVRHAAFASVRPILARSCGEMLARIHSIAPPELPCEMATAQVENLWRTYTVLGNRSPVFELAFRWLRQHLPSSPVVPCLVHGDFRNGNLIISADGIQAVLDWELAHIGDPAEDLGWITVNSWRFGEIDKPVGGFGAIEDLLDGYRAAGGVPVAVDRVRYWQTLGTLRWGVMCGEFAKPPKSGEPISIERSMIGRRVSETEIDLLELITRNEPND
jgi:aminoglycoside phosphotransferase (APT) family kinase protein